MNMSTGPTTTSQAGPIKGHWHLDPTRSSVEFHVRHFYGLMTVKGHFDRFAGTLDLEGQPAIELTIDADSLDTKNSRRDKHLRSADFFDAAEQPEVRFVSDSATLNGEKLSVRGQLHIRGTVAPLTFDATLRPVDAELEVEAVTQLDHRELGMTWSPLGILRAPSTLVVRGRLVEDRGTRA